MFSLRNIIILFFVILASLCIYLFVIKDTNTQEAQKPSGTTSAPESKPEPNIIKGFDSEVGKDDEKKPALPAQDSLKANPGTVITTPNFKTTVPPGYFGRTTTDKKVVLLTNKNATVAVESNPAGKKTIEQVEIEMGNMTASNMNGDSANAVSQTNSSVDINGKTALLIRYEFFGQQFGRIILCVIDNGQVRIFSSDGQSGQLDILEKTVIQTAKQTI